MENTLPSRCALIWEQLHAMAFASEKAFKNAIDALKKRDSSLARLVVESDKSINTFEIDIDNATFDFLSEAFDTLSSNTLQHILSIQKCNPVFERIADHAVNIAESAHTISLCHPNCDLFNTDIMGDRVIKMLHDTITCFFNNDTILARDILSCDYIIDTQYQSIIRDCKNALETHSHNLCFDSCFLLVRICKDIERIADLSINIAEETLLLYEGITIKHQPPHKVLQRSHGSFI